jgi:hypothetical protein
MNLTRQKPVKASTTNCRLRRIDINHLLVSSPILIKARKLKSKPGPIHPRRAPKSFKTLQERSIFEGSREVDYANEKMGKSPLEVGWVLRRDIFSQAAWGASFFFLHFFVFYFLKGETPAAFAPVSVFAPS